MNDAGHIGLIRDPVTSQSINNETTRFLSLALEQPPEEPPCRTPVSTRLDKDIDYVSVLIHRASEILTLAVDGHDDLV